MSALVYAEVYRVDQAQDSGWGTAVEATRTRLYAGVARLMHLRRDWERMSAAEGRISGIVRLVVADDLMGATNIVIDGVEYRVLGVVRQGRNTWEVVYGRWPSA